MSDTNSLPQSGDGDIVIKNEETQVVLAQLRQGQTSGVLEAIMEYTPLMVSYLDTELKYVLVSRTLTELTGLSAEQMIGCTPFEIDPPTEADLRPVLQSVLDTGRAASGKALLLPYKSSKFPEATESFWDFSCTPVIAKDGRIIGLLSTSEDVTEQVWQERQLKESLAKQKGWANYLTAVVNNISEALIVLDAQAEITLANSVAEQFVGRTLVGESGTRALSNRRHLDGTPLEPTETTGFRALHGETVRDLRYIVEDGNRRDCIISASGSPIYDETGQINGGVVIFRDVTEEERQHREVREAGQATEKAQAALLEIASATAGITDLEQLLDRIAELICQIAGCERVTISLYDAKTEELTAMTVHGLAPEDAQQWRQQTNLREHNAPYDNALFEQRQLTLIDFESLQEYARSQGHELSNPYQTKTILALPLGYKSKLIGFLSLDYLNSRTSYSERETQVLEGIGRLTAIAIENVRLLNEASQATTLREANRLKDEFLSLAAHELRNPLTAVQGYTQMIQRRLRKAGIAEADLKPLETIIGQAQRMTRLVEDLLDLSRIETDRLELRLEQTDLAELIMRQIETYQSDSTSHQLILELVNETDRTLYTGLYDAVRLDQVVSNLISNAIKYSPEGGAITIRLQRQKYGQLQLPTTNAETEVLHFSIQDQGIGIPSEQQAALFGRFYRANNGRDSGLPGLGLGLYISSQIIALHGGRMWVESAGEGQGSTFNFVLPVS